MARPFAMTRFGEPFLGEVRTRLSRALASLDPAREPEAEPIGLPFVVAFVAASIGSMFILFHYDYEPGRDVGYHAFCTRIVSEWSSVESPFHARYEPLHPTEANTLMYAIAGTLGRVIDSFTAFRLVRVFYFLGLPLAVLYALRRLGRSPWGALLAFPMSYMQAYIAGFANFSFAAPTFVLALLSCWLLLEQPSRKRAAAASIACALVFLSHVHAYLWLGCLVGLITIYRVAVDLSSSSPRIAERAARSGRTLAVAVGCASPSLLLFGLWYARTYGSGHAVHSEGLVTARDAFGANWLPIARKIAEGHLRGTNVTQHSHEPWWLISTGTLVLIALVLSRLERPHGAPFFELCGILTLLSYYALPDDVSGQQVALRAWDMGAWMVPFMVTPVRAGACRAARWLIIAGIVGLTFGRLRDIQAAVRRFNDDEVAGFDAMVAASPREDLVVAWAVFGLDSPNVVWLPFYEWHQMFGARTGLEAPLYTTRADSNSPVRYRIGPPAAPTLMLDEPDWGDHPQLWENFDLVLVKGWRPDASQLEHVRSRATLLASSGEWQLWRRIGPPLEHPSESVTTPTKRKP